MSPTITKLLMIAGVALLLVSAGTGFGAWLAAGHYRPLLDASNKDLAKATLARDNLITLTDEQGHKLGDLVQAGELRERAAALALEKARAEAQPDYEAANRILRERTSGDQCVAAESIINQELGL